MPEPKRVRLHLLSLALLPFLAACPEQRSEVLRWEAAESLGQRGQAFAQAGDRLYAFVDGDLQVSNDRGASWTRPERAGLPKGEVTLLQVLPGESPVLLAHLFGHGLFRSTDDGRSFSPVDREPTNALVGLLNPRGKVVPFAIAAEKAGPTYLAGIGGLFRSDDAGRTYASAGVTSNVIFTGVGKRGDRVVAVAQLPEYLLPSQYHGLLDGRLFASDDDGASWDDLSDELDARALTGVAVAEDGTAWIAAMDGGLFRLPVSGSAEAMGGPSDAIAVSLSHDGVNVASGARGLWRLADGEWTHGAAGPVIALGEDVALAHDGRLWRLARGKPVAPPESAGGTVHIALSFHTNLYHSYRGDTVDEKGFGMDIRVIRTVLDWLEKHPEVAGDWDIENYFSVDGWLKEHAPDILARIRERVQDGRDGMRLMSWNNGAMSAKTKEEFTASVRLAKESYLAAFGRFDPGVQPQECMFTPEHVGWYRDEGIEWITLFNSATPFTSFRQDVTLKGRELYGPLKLVEGDDSMTLVPVYHQGDLMNHGGLAAWARQVHDTHSGDSLIVVHLDADAEVWVNFDRELPAVKALPFVKFTTIQNYLDTHDPVGTVSLPGDVADGTGDGYQSWAEKDFNHRIFTRIVRARSLTELARVLAPEDSTVESLVEDAIAPRLVALSTTHFGLAAPFLADERVASTERYTDEALAAAEAAYAAAETTRPVAPGTIELVNARDASGPALVETELEIPLASWSGPDGLTILDETGKEIAAVVGVIDGDEIGSVTVGVRFVAQVEARSIRTLSWRYDPANPAKALGQEEQGTSPTFASLEAPFTECRGVRADAAEQGTSERVVDSRRNSDRVTTTFSVPLCEASGTTRRVVERFDGLPGTIVSIDAEMGATSRPTDAESIALTPFGCSGDAHALRWRSFGGRVMERPVRPGQQTWNAVAADGWVALKCDDGSTLQVSHRMPQRTSMAFAPLRNDQGRAVLAPLGTLWGAPPWHDTRRDGGHGLGDVAVGLVGSQFRPAAPDWSGKAIDYRLLVGEDLPEAVLDLFAHPPHVRAGTYAAP